MTRPGRLPDLDPDADAPEWWRRSRGLRRLPLIALILLGVIVYQAVRPHPGPAIRKSCRTPAFVLSAQVAQPHKPVEWSVTGPPGSAYQLAVGVRRYDVTSDRLVPVPDPGLTNRQTQPASSRIRIGASCLASGVFGVLVPPGSYTVRLFRVTGSGTAQSLTAVARTSLRVTAS